MTTRISALAFACFSLSSFANSAHAHQSPLDDSYFAAKLSLGFGGKGSAHASTPIGSWSAESDLEPSFGAGLQYMVPLHRYFALGGLLGFSSWQSKSGSDAKADRSTTLDLAVVPQAKFGLARDLELYISVPLGLTLDFWNAADAVLVTFPGGDAELKADPAVGFMVSALLGLRWLLTDHIGLFTEVGYTHRSFTHTIKPSVTVLGNSAAASFDVDIALGQFVWNLGVSF
jgi:Outer membrane protein beta-barrel domain